MALFLTYVLSWQADSWKRVRDTVDGTLYLLNTNRLDSMRVLDGTADDGTTSLYYFDNPFDHRDAGLYMVLDMPVNDLVNYIDTALAHGSITIAVYPNDDATETPVDTEIGCAYFAYAVEDINDATKSRVTYATSGWDIKTVLVNNTLADLRTQAMT